MIGNTKIYGNHLDRDVNDIFFDEYATLQPEYTRYMKNADAPPGNHYTEAELSPFEAEVTTVLRDLLAWLNERGGREVHQSGVRNVLAQPEFATGELARQFLDLFERSAFLDQMLSGWLGVGSGDVHVIIGAEGPWEELSDLSLVLGQYGVRDVASGALGVLGPRRMRYERAVSAVRYVSDLLSGLICDWYGL